MCVSNKTLDKKTKRLKIVFCKNIIILTDLSHNIKKALE